VNPGAEGALDRARRFVGQELKPLARELDVAGRFPGELLERMKEEGFFGLNYPVEFGGGGQDSPTTYQVLTELAKASAGVALTLHVHYMAVDALIRFGTEPQQNKYMRGMLAGERIGAFTISEASAGSDAAAITATARAGENGWVLNGTKYFCTNGGLADLYLVAMKTDPDAGAKGISLFLVEKGTPGFTIGQPEEKMGCRSSVTTSLAFNNCLIPTDNLIGQVNDGFKIVMYGLTGGRLGMASMGLGVAEAAFEAAAEYATRRMAFGKPLTALFAVQEMLADMFVALEGARLVVASTATARDSGRDYAMETSVAKILVARASGEITSKALQIFGGHGYMKHNPVERFVRDARLMDIGVGASEVLKMVLAGVIARKFAAKPIRQ